MTIHVKLALNLDFAQRTLVASQCGPNWLPLNMKGPEQGRAHIPDPDPDPELRIKSPDSVPDPSVPDHRMQYQKSDVELGVRSMPVPYLFHTRSRPNKVFSTYSPCIIVGTSKRQSSFHTLRINYAIQTLRIRQHRNVHSGHVVLISSQLSLEGAALLCTRHRSSSEAFPCGPKPESHGQRDFLEGVGGWG